MANTGTIVESGKRIKWERTAEGISYSNGKKTKCSPETMDPKLSYKLAKEDVVIIPPVVTPPVIIIPPVGAREISWKDFTMLKDVQGEKFKITGGDYRNQGQARISNFKDVSVDMSGCQFGEKGAVTIEMVDSHNNVSFNGGLNTNGSQVFIQHRFVNDGVSENISVIGAVSDNGGSLFSHNGNLTENGFTTPLRGLKIIGCTAKNCPSLGQAIYAKSVEDAEIANNYFENNNTAVNNDTGMIIIMGNGKIYGNKAYNYQGHLVRSNPMQVLGSGKTLDMYNNFAMLTRKYGMFESQIFQDDMGNKFFKPADVNIFNNTGGRFNTSNDWDAMFLDLYTSFNKISFYNNLGFEMKRVVNTKVGTINIGDMINHNEDASSTKVVRNNGNKYFDTYEQAMAYQKANPGSVGSSITL